MLPWRKTVRRWAAVCLCAGLDGCEVGESSTADGGSLGQPGAPWPTWPGAAGDTPALLIASGSAQNIQIPHLSAVWEVSQQPHSIFFCALVLDVLEIEFILPLPHFTAAHRAISFLEPLRCFLRGNCVKVRKHIQGLLLCLVIASEFVLTVFLLIQTQSFSIILLVLRRGLLSACLECSLCKILPAVKLARKVSKLHICAAGSAHGKCYRYALVWKPRSK